MTCFCATPCVTYNRRGRSAVAVRLLMTQLEWWTK